MSPRMFVVASPHHVRKSQSMTELRAPSCWFRKMYVAVPLYGNGNGWPWKDARRTAQFQMEKVNCRPGRAKFVACVRMHNMDYAEYRFRAYPRFVAWIVRS